MPKKKSARKPASRPDRVPRKEPYTAERLRTITEHLREQSMRLAGMARAMDDGELKSVVVDGHAMLIRGLTQIDNFADNCARALREAKSQRTKL